MTSREIDGVIVLEMRGKLDINSSMALKEDFGKFISDGKKSILINMADVDFINSSGLGALVSGLKMVREENGVLKLCSLRQYVKELFEVSQLTKIFSIFENEKDALKSF